MVWNYLVSNIEIKTYLYGIVGGLASLLETNQVAVGR